MDELIICSVTLPTADALALANVSPDTFRYPSFEVDGHRFDRLCDEIIDLVPEWDGRREEIKALGRAAAVAQSEAAIVSEAKLRLTKTDHWPLKAMEIGAPMADNKRAYRDALRSIVREPSAFRDWPQEPAD